MCNCFFISSCKGAVVSSSKKSGACTFSAISGHIYNHGKPIGNSRVIRTTDWQKKKIDETVTDENGYFEMPALYESSVANILPMEFVVSQTIDVVVDGEKFEFWSGVKRSKNENTEGQGRPPIVRCELSEKRKSIMFDRQIFMTKCTWAVTPEKPMSIEEMLKTNDD